MVYVNGSLASAMYWSLSIGSEATNYTLTVSGYDGQAGGDAFDKNAQWPTWISNGQPFSTKDRDNDRLSKENCAAAGGWWYNACSISALNEAGLGSWMSAKAVLSSRMAISRV